MELSAQSRETGIGSVFRKWIFVGILTIVLAMEMPDITVVRSQEVPGFYSETQGLFSNLGIPSSRVDALGQSLLANEGTPVLSMDQPPGFSISAEALYMGLKGDALVYAQQVQGFTQTTFDNYGGVVTRDRGFGPPENHTVKARTVKGLGFGLNYQGRNWDAQLLYSRLKAKPVSDSAPRGIVETSTVATTYGGSTVRRNINAPIPAVAPPVAHDSYNAEADFEASLCDFTAGYWIRLGRNTATRFSLGLQHLRVENSLQAGGQPLGGGVSSVNREVTYRGTGPKVGLKVEHNPANSRFVLEGSAEVGKLYGSSAFHLDGSLPGVAFADRNESTRLNTRFFEGEAAVRYAFPTVDVTLGYRLLQFSVHNTRHFDSGAAYASGVQAESGDHSSTQSLHGPFVRLGVKL